MENKNLKFTPLHDEHVSLKAKMVPFGGWDMPVQYDGILKEYEYTRRGVAIFDICHMGEFLVFGDAVESGLDNLVTQKIADMPVGTCRYGCMLNDRGGIMDDLIVFRKAEQEWFIVVNASTTAKDAAHFQKHLSPKAQFKDISSQTGKIDIQGPLSRDVMKNFAPGIEKLEFYSFGMFKCLGEEVLISRTGYTGELGYEIYMPWSKAADFWKALLKDARVKPAGLGARDVLRLEVGYSLYGHELNEEKTPLESSLTRFVNFDKDFIGKNALITQKNIGLNEQVIGFTALDRRSPRAEQKLFAQDGSVIGVVTSGSFSPALIKGIGLGFVKTGYAKQGTSIFFGEDKSKNPAIVSSRIFYKGGSLKQ
ncbi:MAG: glycine cleavage system aminomethyltransferase GcvT [Candidatus Omnitrophica bacterium]|nr:glycine cleavage system aminomethyltransferase GcvT [Candidatus Omnitrophota bacterium]